MHSVMTREKTKRIFIMVLEYRDRSITGKKFKAKTLPIVKKYIKIFKNVKIPLKTALVDGSTLKIGDIVM